MTKNKINQTNSRKNIFYKFSDCLRKLKKNESGLAAIEFAISMPVLMGLGMYGTETAFLATTNTKLSQAALNLADNASRIGQTDTGIPNYIITEQDVAQVFIGLKLQTESIALLENGRVILSSLEFGRDEDGAEKQFIRWQRCKGVREYESSYGTPSTPDTVSADFEEGLDVRAVEGSAVMLVEIEYKYQPLFGNAFHSDRILRQVAAFNIRDDRDLVAGIINPPDDDVVGDPASCTEFNAT
jgi:Flp pilus assembly pilin Flp